MRTLVQYRKLEGHYRLRAAVDETNREEWIAQSNKWRERAELEIQACSFSGAKRDRSDNKV